MTSSHDPAYVAALADQLQHATEFRVPCGQDPDLLVIRDPDGDGWAIADSADPEQVWLGTWWTFRSHPACDNPYRFTREQALTEALRLANRPVYQPIKENPSHG